VILAALLNGGCFLDDWLSRKDNSPPKSSTTASADFSRYPQAPLEVAARVDQVGHKILAANPDVKLTPLFLTIGSSNQSIYHTGIDQLMITEGLVKRCSTDGELAALLCHELAAMEVERRRTIPAKPATDRLPPPAPEMGNASGSFGPDPFRMTEIGDWEKRNPRKSSADQRPPTESPEQAARDYFIKSGFTQDEFNQALPLVKFAQTNAEKDKGKLGN
jgi:hypothetical protein